MSKPICPVPLRETTATGKAIEAEATALLKADKEAQKAQKKARKADQIDSSDVGRLEKRHATDAVVTSQTRSYAGQLFNIRGVAEVLMEHGMNPAEEILRAMPDLEADVRARLFSELLQYIQPKLKSIEVTGKGGGPLEVVSMTPEQRDARIAELQKKLASSAG